MAQDTLFALINEVAAFRATDEWQNDANDAFIAMVASFVKSKDAAYTERNRILAALTKVIPSHLCKHDESDETWDNDWRNIVCVHCPVPIGNLTWHIHDSHLPWFSHLHTRENHWDGHTTDEKYARLEQLPLFTADRV